MYKVGAAATNRSTCIKCKTGIALGALRVGSLDSMSNTWGRWSCASCWQVPLLVHATLVDLEGQALDAKLDVLEAQGVVAGISELSPAAREFFLGTITNRARWAKPNVASKRKLEEVTKTPVSKKTKASEAAVTQSESILGRTFVLTGTFEGGKERVTDLIVAFGGRVTSALSTKSNFLVVGTLPGASKLNEAQRLGVKIVDMNALALLTTGKRAEDVKDASLDVELSRGYGGRGGARLVLNLD